HYAGGRFRDSSARFATLTRVAGPRPQIVSALVIGYTVITRIPTISTKGDPMTPKNDINRRDLLAPAAAGLALTLVPRHVLGGPGYVPPSDKITLAYIGCGTQGTREMLRLLATPDVQITAVCDPVKDGTNYVDWDK